MSEIFEFEGKNIEKALEKAGMELNVNVSELKYDVVSHGSSGIFGLVGVKKAKIRIQLDKKVKNEKIEKAPIIQSGNLVQGAFNDEDVVFNSEISESEEGTDNNDEIMNQAVGLGLEALTRLVNAISEDAVISVERQKDRMLYKIDGGNSAVLIGKRGQTLEAIQYLVEKIVNKKNNAHIRVMVDVKGYLDARKSSLKKLATKLADKARKTNKPVTIGQMNAYDRRIVHMSLKDNQDVRTQSMGEGYYRKLVIFPKKRRQRNTSNAS